MGVTINGPGAGGGVDIDLGEHDPDGDGLPTYAVDLALPVGPGFHHDTERPLGDYGPAVASPGLAQYWLAGNWAMNKVGLDDWAPSTVLDKALRGKNPLPWHKEPLPWSADRDLDIVESRMRAGYPAAQSTERRSTDADADLKQLNQARMFAGKAPLVPRASDTQISDLAIAESRVKAGYSTRENKVLDAFVDAQRKVGAPTDKLRDRQADFDELSKLRAAKARADKAQLASELFRDLF
jgi:hypothetical protein